MQNKEQDSSPKIALGGLSVLLGNTSGVVDFQATRCSIHAQSLHDSIHALVTELALESDVMVYSQHADVGKDKSYALSGLNHIRVGDTHHLSVSWVPFVLVIDGIAVVSLHSEYDTAGARVYGVTLNIDGKDTYTDCKTLSSVRKICVSYIRTYVQ